MALAPLGTRKKHKHFGPRMLGQWVLEGAVSRTKLRRSLPDHLSNAIVRPGQDGKHEVFQRDQPDAHLDKLRVMGIAGIPNARLGRCLLIVFV